MTDRNEVANHEKLIEEALSAYWGGADNAKGIGSVEGMREALALFEKALGEATVTPTDDEREALAFTLFLIESGQDEDWLRGVWANHPAEHPVKVGYYRQADAILAAGFRRSAVPEPSAEPTCICPNTLGWHTTECVTSRPEPETAEAQAYSKGFTEGSDQAHRDMQGEPSSIPFYDEKMRELAEVRAQGEPSDARVDAALSTYKRYYREDDGSGDPSRNAMRAALRAANEVR